jgi:hypothetical protein
MKQFIKNLISNRFAIVLAALNLCYFASNAFSFPSGGLSKIMLSLNSPATILTLVSYKVIQFLFSASSIILYRQAGFFVFSFFIILQWLLIGWTAKTIARRIQPNRI